MNDDLIAPVFHLWGRGGILARIMRKRPTIDATSEAEFSLAAAKRMISDLQERVLRLEAELFGTGAWVLGPPPVKPRMGRKRKLEQQELLKRRNELSNWVERDWPFLSVALRKARNADHALAAVLAAKERVPFVMQASFYRDPEECKEQLWEFLESGKFSGNPRNLAGAVAGLPELSWKRSLDISQQNPCQFPLAQQAWPDFMRRKFPVRLRELLAVATPEDAKAVLARSKTTDPTYLYLKKHPEEALLVLKAAHTSKR
jgi:hypothetical protein